MISGSSDEVAPIVAGPVISPVISPTTGPTTGPVTSPAKIKTPTPLPTTIQTIINNASHYIKPQYGVDVLLIALTFVFITVLFRKDTIIFDSCYSGAKLNKNDTYAEYKSRLWCLFKLDISFFTIMLTGLLVIPLLSDMMRSVNNVPTEQYFNKIDTPLFITIVMYLSIQTWVALIKWVWGYFNQSKLEITPVNTLIIRSVINGITAVWLIILIILNRTFL